MRRKEKRMRHRPAAYGSAARVEKHLVTLTPRQREIALLVANGDRNKEIASRLNITERTVKAHLTTVYLKLRLSSRVHLIHLIGKYSRSVRQFTSH